MQKKVDKYTCYKIVENPSCIDLVITNSPLTFQNTETRTADFSDFHKMVITLLKTAFAKLFLEEVGEYGSNDIWD